MSHSCPPHDWTPHGQCKYCAEWKGVQDPAMDRPTSRKGRIYVDGSYMAQTEHAVIAAAFRFVETHRRVLTERSKANDVDEAVDLLHAIDRLDWPKKEWSLSPPAGGEGAK